MSIEAKMTYNKQQSPNYPSTGYGQQNYIYNLVLWTGADVDIRDFQNYWVPGKEGIEQNYYNKLYYNNPYFLAYENIKAYEKDTNYGFLKLNYDLGDLKFFVRSSVNWYRDKWSESLPWSMLGDGGANKYGNYKETRSYMFDINNDFLFEYDKELHEDWRLRATAGGNMYWYDWNKLSAETDGLNVPEWYHLNNSKGERWTNNEISQRKMFSLYATADISYKEMIYFGVTGRNDWSSAFQEDNNSYFYPSGSLGVIISEMIDFPDWVTFAKVRSSAAQVSSDFGMYQTVNAYNVSGSVIWDGNTSAQYPGVEFNPDIKPSTSTTYEVGADIRFLQNRLGFDLTYFHIFDTNNIIQMPVSDGSGINATYVNANTYLRKGLELIVNATPVKNKTMTWNTTFNWSTYRRYLHELDPMFGDSYNNLKEGDRTDMIYSGGYLRRENGDLVLGSNAMPIWTSKPMYYGNSLPDWRFGFNNSFSFKNLTVNVGIDGQFGGLIYNTTASKMYYGGTHPNTVSPHRDAENEGNATYIPDGWQVSEGEIRLDDNGNIINESELKFTKNEKAIYWSDWHKQYTQWEYKDLYQDASYIKLREVSIHYQLPSQWVERFSMSGASIGFVGRNLAMWTNAEFIDPDTGSGDLQSPSPRSLGFNVKLSF